MTREDGTWVWRDLAGGWRLEHRVPLDTFTPVIAETRLRPRDPAALPPGGLGADTLRLVTVRGAREAAGPSLLSRTAGDDLRDLDAGVGRRTGDDRAWTLAVTSLFYAQAVAAGSSHPSEDVAAALDVPVRTVRDRLYAARRADPPMLTGGGRRGVVGHPEVTPEGMRVLKAYIGHVTAPAREQAAALGAIITKGLERALASLDPIRHVDLLRDAKRQLGGLLPNAATTDADDEDPEP